MELNVKEALRKAGEKFPFQLSLSLDPMTVHGDEVSFPQPILLTGAFMGFEEDEESVLLTGKLSYTWESLCARCAEPARDESTLSFEETFCRVQKEEYPDRYLFSGEKVDVTQMVEDLIVMDLPIRFLCREDCKGLCPVCGINKNKQTCTCSNTGRESPFAVLKNLHLDEE